MGQGRKEVQRAYPVESAYCSFNDSFLATILSKISEARCSFSSLCLCCGRYKNQGQSDATRRGAKRIEGRKGRRSKLTFSSGCKKIAANACS